MKQTAVEWLAEIIAQMGYVSTELLEQAKEMEKEQIIKARLSLDKSDNIWDKEIALEISEQYYNETYKQD